MNVLELQPGDTVYAAIDLYNDGSLPDQSEGELIAAKGTRGVIINTGHLEEDPNQAILLVRFEGENLSLGPAIGCWPSELSDKADNE